LGAAACIGTGAALAAATGTAAGCTASDRWRWLLFRRDSLGSSRFRTALHRNGNRSAPPPVHPPQAQSRQRSRNPIPPWEDSDPGRSRPRRPRYRPDQAPRPERLPIHHRLGALLHLRLRSALRTRFLNVSFGAVRVASAAQGRCESPPRGRRFVDQLQKHLMHNLLIGGQLGSDAQLLHQRVGMRCFASARSLETGHSDCGRLHPCL